jgi:carboxypeptidase Taq
MWENMIGRSRAFWRHYFPIIQAQFPQALGTAQLEACYRSVNRVVRGPNRVEADEVTYNLHIALRFQLELLLLRDALPLEDLPEEWNRLSEKLIGVRPRDDVEGVLQDIHWAFGEFGYFPTYALGNLYAASLFAAAKRELPALDEALGQGDFQGIRDWLRRRIHSEGYRYPAEELVRRITGTGLTDADFIEYLQSKYGEMYGLTFAASRR